MSEDPVDDPDGQEKTEPNPEAPAEPLLELPPETGEAEHLERRARLAEDRLTEVLTAYRQLKTENEGFRERVRASAARVLAAQSSRHG